MSIFNFLGMLSNSKTDDDGGQALFKQISEELRENMIQDFHDSPEELSSLEAFAETLERSARKHVDSLRPTDPEEAASSEPSSADALPLFYVSDDCMRAYSCVLPPLNEGKHIEQSHFFEDLRYAGITSGLDQAAIEELVAGRNYLHIVQVAKGTAPVDGKDGELEELFERKAEQELDLKESDSLAGLDLKTRYIVHTVQKGDAICRIKPPSAASDGINVCGHVLHGKEGRPARIPQGENTVLTDHGMTLSASISGIITTEADNFTIRSQRIITADVNAMIGKISCEGDLFIRGNIEDGAAVSATGNVIISGDVRSGKVSAGGTLLIQGEVKSSAETSLEAGGQIQCPILEGISVHAKGNIYADVIANCSVSSETGSVYALTGRGLIFGGDVKVHKSVYARKIGNMSGCKNSFTLGSCPELEAEEAKIQDALKSVQDTHEKLRQSIASMKASGMNLQRDKKEGLSKLSEQQSLYESLAKEKAKELKELKKEISLKRQGHISCEELYPTTQVHIGSQSLTVEKEEMDCNIHLTSGNTERILLK